MTEPFLGEIRMFAGNFAPRGWMHCDGQLLPIAQNTALFSLLGTTYGGDGRTTFALPDLRGRSPMHVGRGPGLTDRRQGQKLGTETNTLTSGKTIPGGPPSGVGQPPGGTQTAVGQNLDNIHPVQVVRFIIAIQGLFPSRN